MTVGPDFAFIAVPRTASTVMATLFLPQFGGRSDGRNHHARFVLPGHAHLFRFAVVRNPYDRMLSIYHHLAEADRTYNIREMAFPQWMDFMEKHWGFGGWNQTRFLEGTGVQQILRFEQIETDVLSLPFNTEGIAWPTERQNISRRKPLSEELTDEYREIIYRHSEPDFERFEYTP